MTVMGTMACGGGGGALACNFALPSTSSSPPPAPTAAATDRKYLLERVDEAAVVQLYADAFRDLTLKDKTLVWHLYQAAIAGRDIYYDQKYVHNLEMRDVLEAIITHPAGVDPKTLDEITRYTKLFWINTGPYNNLTARKFVLQCTPEALAAAAHAAEKAGAPFPLKNGETLDQLLARLKPAFFDPNVDPTITAKTPPPGKDILTASANNLYVGVTMKDLEGFVEEFPLNSRLVKANGKLVEEVYRIDGRYGKQIAAIVQHLEAAIPYATEPMQKALRALITFYQTGDTKDREAYDIAWVLDKASPRRHDERVHRGLPGRARHQGRVRSAGLLREQGEDLRDPEDRAERAVVRGPDAVGSEIPEAGRAGHHGQRHRRGHRDRRLGSRHAGRHQPAQRSGDLASATAASRCRCRTSARRTTSRRCRRFAASSRGRRKRPRGRRNGARSPAS